MAISSTILFLVPMLGLFAGTRQNEGSIPPSFAPENLGTGLHVLRSPDKNVIVSTGEDGTVLLDDGYIRLNDDIRIGVHRVTKCPVRFIVKSAPLDTGDNAVLGRPGTVVLTQNAGPELIPLAEFYERVGRGCHPSLPQPPVVALPDGTVLNWNGITIASRQPRDAPADSELALFLGNAQVVYVSGLSLRPDFPFIDIAPGRNFLGLVENIWAIVSDINATAAVVPSRGPTLDRASLSDYAANLDALSSILANSVSEETHGLVYHDAAEVDRSMRAALQDLETGYTQSNDISIEHWLDTDPSHTEALLQAALSSLEAHGILTSGGDTGRALSTEWPMYRIPCRNGYTQSTDIYSGIVDGQCDLIRQPWGKMTKVVAIGDSWFTYPGSLSALADHGTVNRSVLLLNTAGFGNQILDLADKKRRDELVELLKATTPDYLLVSYGGNDLIDENTLKLVLTRIEGSTSSWNYLQHIDREMLGVVLDMIESVFKYILLLVNEHSRNTYVVIHTYDEVKPRPAGVSANDVGAVGVFGYGPWVHPVMKEKGIHPDHHDRIAQHLLRELSERIKGLQTNNNLKRGVVIDTYRTLHPWVPEDWTDEIHPSRLGFCKLWLEFSRRLNAAHGHRASASTSHFLKKYGSSNICRSLEGR